MGFLEIFDVCPGYIILVSWIYFIVILEIFYCSPRDILLMSWI